MKKFKIGQEIYSQYFKDWIKIIEINSDTDWYFEVKGKVLKAKTPLSFFEKKASFIEKKL